VRHGVNGEVKVKKRDSPKKDKGVQKREILGIGTKLNMNQKSREA